MKPFRLLTLLPLLAFVSPSAGYAAPDTTVAAQKIDAILKTDWDKNKLKGNPAIDDATFVRRIYLDVIGRIPTTRETEDFLNSKAGNKRAKLIDKLLASEGYVQHSFNYWADVLRAQSNGSQAGAITGSAYVTFLKDGLRNNKPYDKLVRELISAQGESWDNGAIGYYMRDRGMPLDNMANTARIFLGTRVECAQCHNHPFDKWTQMQFYQMAAFTYPVQTNDYYGASVDGARGILREREQAARDKFKLPPPPKGKKMTEAERKEYRTKMEVMGKEGRLAGDAVRKENRFVDEVFNNVRNNVRYTTVGYTDGRKLTLPQDYQYSDAKPRSAVSAKTMFGHEANAQAGETQLEAYARWMAAPSNERFNKVIANRLWKRVFGLALIEPLDELMDTTVAVNPELQAHLDKLIVDLKYDMKAYLRILYNTSAYQRQATREDVSPGIVYHFTGPLLRRMTAEQMWDSFVTLINPSPDMPNEAFRDLLTRRVLAAKKISDSLESLTPEEVLVGAEDSAKKFKAQSDRVRELQKQIAEARAKEDKETSNRLREELRKLEQATRYSVNKNIILPGMQKLAAKAGVVPVMLSANKGDSKVVAATSMDMMMSAMGNGDVKDKIFIPGYDKPERTKEEAEAYQKVREEAWKEEAAFYQVPEKELKYYYRSRAEQTRNWVRSGEIESPAPRGHYLREFGQSDRESIENANNEASVPQALALMNGQLLPQILNRYSQLSLTISKAPYPDDKVDAVYMTMLSRKPTANEKAVWLKGQDQGLNTMEDLIFALINTQQFIFIQ
jgi:hypothetical protein